MQCQQLGFQNITHSGLQFSSLPSHQQESLDPSTTQHLSSFVSILWIFTFYSEIFFYTLWFLSTCSFNFLLDSITLVLHIFCLYASFFFFFCSPSNGFFCISNPNHHERGSGCFNGPLSFLMQKTVSTQTLSLVTSQAIDWLLLGLMVQSVVLRV